MSDLLTHTGEPPEDFGLLFELDERGGKPQASPWAFMNHRCCSTSPAHAFKRRSGRVPGPHPFDCLLCREIRFRLNHNVPHCHRVHFIFNVYYTCSIVGLDTAQPGARGDDSRGSLSVCGCRAGRTRHR